MASALTIQRELPELSYTVHSLNKYLGIPYKLDEKEKSIETAIKEFNAKYQQVKLAIKKTVTHIILEITLPHQQIQGLFLSHVITVHGLKSVGRDRFDEFPISAQEDIRGLLESKPKKLYLSFTTPQSHTVNMLLEESKNGVSVRYDPEDFNLPQSPLLHLILKVASTGDIDEDKDIFKKGGHIGFTDLLDERERKKRLDAFNPRFTE